MNRNKHNLKTQTRGKRKIYIRRSMLQTYRKLNSSIKNYMQITVSSIDTISLVAKWYSTQQIFEIFTYVYTLGKQPKKI